jgi:DNA (cytosine-5)-methyltransferase 1
MDTRANGGSARNHFESGVICHDVAPTLNAHFGEKQGLENQHIDGGAGLFVMHAQRGEGFDAREAGTERGTPLAPVAYRTTGNAGAYATGNAVGALTTTTDPNAQVVAVPRNSTLPWAVRRLTPIECERLQAFPDGWTDIPWRGRANAPDGLRYKALGNSMAVNVIRWIGRRIELVEMQP